MEDFSEDLEDFEPEETIPCEMCSGTCYSMGYLGSRQHFQCRQCGAQFSHKEEK